jgi:hypothetical protein
MVWLVLASVALLAGALVGRRWALLVTPSAVVLCVRIYLDDIGASESAIWWFPLLFGLLAAVACAIGIVVRTPPAR